MRRTCVVVCADAEGIARRALDLVVEACAPASARGQRTSR